MTSEIATPAPEAGRGPAARTTSLLRVALGIAAATHLVLLLAPWQFGLPGRGLGSSFTQVLSHAAASGWQWGSDIAFTYGPLGYLRSPIFQDELLASVLTWNGFLAVAFVVAVLALLQRVPLSGAIPVYLVIAVAVSTRTGKGEYLLLPFLAVLLHFRDPGNPRPWAAAIAMAGSAVYGLAYTSLLVSGLAASALIDFSRILHRRWPFFVPAFAIVVIAAWLASGQSIANLPAFLRSVYEMISGYPEAMSVAGNRSEMLAFLGLSAATLVLVVRTEAPRLVDRSTRVDSLLLLAGCAAYWLVTWKTGFVRHDMHTVVAWTGLAMGLAAYGAARWNASTGLSRAAFVTTAVVAWSLFTVSGNRPFSVDRLVDSARAALVDIPQRSAREGALALRDTPTWIDGLRRSRDDALGTLRHAYPELSADGSVDLVGYDQGALLAHRVAYRPQPVFQSLAAYTPWLIELNRRHLRSDRAADTLFLSSASIDNRYPVSELGRAIVEVTTRYRPESTAGDYVRLSRLAKVVERSPVAIGETDATLGSWTPVPHAGLPILMQADTQPSVLGRLAKAVLRPPPLQISVQLANGQESTHRIVPSVLADGILLSPYAPSATTIAGLMLGERVAESNRVLAVRIDAATEGDRAFFGNHVPVRFSRWDVATDEGARPSPYLQQIRDRRQNAATLARSASGPPGAIEARDTLAFAHAPATLEIGATSVRRIGMRYGIYDGAWTGENRTDGVCFRIRGVDGAGRVVQLHERCLRPLDQADDRGEKSVVLDVSTADLSKVILETDCGGTCSWDWSYWKDVDLVR